MRPKACVVVAVVVVVIVVFKAPVAAAGLLQSSQCESWQQTGSKVMQEAKQSWTKLSFVPWIYSSCAAFVHLAGLRPLTPLPRLSVLM